MKRAILRFIIGLTFVILKMSVVFSAASSSLRPGMQIYLKNSSGERMLFLICPHANRTDPACTVHAIVEPAADERVKLLTSIFLIQTALNSGEPVALSNFTKHEIAAETARLSRKLKPTARFYAAEIEKTLSSALLSKANCSNAILRLSEALSGDETDRVEKSPPKSESNRAVK
jgi:nucleoid DNA-binding protein